jgi:hypothetical protein
MFKKNFVKKNSAAGKPRGSLAILVPTFRFDAEARYSLGAAASMASEDIAICIADNSENPEKWDYLRKLGSLHSNIHIYCHKENIGALRNWRFLLDQSPLSYYLFIGDDDFCTPQYIDAAFQQLEGHPEAVAAAGRFIMITSRNQMMAGNGARMEDSPAQRCVNFQIGGGNSLPNSMARRAAIQPFLDYQAMHPLKASFFDWIMSYTLLAQGKYTTQDRGHYLYDVSNWENPASCWRSNAAFYVAAGLDESFTWFHELYWAVELVHFFRSSYAPLVSENEQRDCAQFFYLNRIREFRRLWTYAPHAEVFRGLLGGYPTARKAVDSIVTNDDAFHPELFAWFTHLLSVFDPMCARAYADYVASSLSAVKGRARVAGT